MIDKAVHRAILAKTASLGRYQRGMNHAFDLYLDELFILGWLSRDGKNVYTLTPQGIAALREHKIYAVQVDFPNQPPLILKDWDDFLGDVKGGEIKDIFDCCLSGKVHADMDGHELFKVSVKVIDLYSLATLPEWEPV